MNDYLTLLTLAYFKEHLIDYSLDELKGLIGISYIQLDELLQSMLQFSLLEYRSGKLTLTLKGRMKLADSSMDTYKEVDAIDAMLFDERWPVDQPFLVHGFSRNKWINA